MNLKDNQKLFVKGRQIYYRTDVDAAVKELKLKMKKKFEIVVDPDILYKIIDEVFGE